MTTNKPKKSDISKEKILKASLELFQVHGYEQTTMRAIAEKADMSLGAAYYYFKTKDELVLHYYAESSKEVEHRLGEILAKESDYKTCFKLLLQFKHEQLLPVRSFFGVLVQQAGNLQNPLSPFSSSTKELRDEAIGQIEYLIENSNLKVHKVLRPHMAKLFWLYQMGIVLYWINDTSHEQVRTNRLIDLSLELILTALSMSNLPLMGQINKSLVKVVQLVESCTATPNLEEQHDA